MRLTPKEINEIKKVISTYDPHAQIYLFGSRVHDEKKGGDIDLLVFSQKIDRSQRRQIVASLWEALGEQKIDLLVAKNKEESFVQLALEEAVLL